MVTAFIVTNIVIAIGYALLAVFFAMRLRLPRQKLQGWRTIVTFIFAAMFFVGCAHTHIDLALWGAQGELIHHWFSPLNVASHILQGIGGIGFWLFATLWVKITIFDRKDFEKKIKTVEEEFKSNKVV